MWAPQGWPDPAELAPSPVGNTGKLLWRDNWVAFLDSMLQISILGTTQRSLRLPTRIAAVHIDPATHRQKVYALQRETQGSPAPARSASHTGPAPGTAPAHPLSLQWSTWWWTGVYRARWPGAFSSRGCTPRWPRGGSTTSRPPWRSSASRRTWRPGAWSRARPCRRSCSCAGVRPAPGARAACAPPAYSRGPLGAPQALHPQQSWCQLLPCPFLVAVPQRGPSAPR